MICLYSPGDSLSMRDAFVRFLEVHPVGMLDAAHSAAEDEVAIAVVFFIHLYLILHKKI